MKQVIHGVTIFSTADLRDYTSFLFAKLKYKGEIIDVKIILENEEEETTDVELYDGTQLTVKTKKLKNFVSYVPQSGEKCPVLWR